MLRWRPTFGPVLGFDLIEHVEGVFEDDVVGAGEAVGEAGARVPEPSFLEGGVQRTSCARALLAVAELREPLASFGSLLRGEATRAGRLEPRAGRSPEGDRGPPRCGMMRSF